MILFLLKNRLSRNKPTSNVAATMNGTHVKSEVQAIKKKKQKKHLK